MYPKMAFFLSCLWLCACVATRPDDLSARLLAVLDDPATVFSYDTADIPAPVWRKIRQISAEGYIYNGEFGMAPPAAPFNRTCVREEGLLSRRLVALARRGDEYLICYERGGRGHNLLVSFSHVRGRRVSYYNLSLRGIPVDKYTDPEALRQALREGRYLISYNNGRKTVRSFTPF